MQAEDHPEFRTLFQTFLSSTLQMNSMDEVTEDINGSGGKILKNQVLKSLVGEIRNLKTMMDTIQQVHEKRQESLEQHQKVHEKHQESLEQQQKELAEHEHINSLAAITDDTSVDLEIHTKARQQVNAYWAKEVQVAASVMQQNNKENDEE